MKKLILFELRKVFSKRLALIALIGIILFSALLSFSTFQNKYAFDQNIGEGTGKTAVKISECAERINEYANEREQPYHHGRSLSFAFEMINKLIYTLKRNRITSPSFTT